MPLRNRLRSALIDSDECCNRGLGKAGLHHLMRPHGVVRANAHVVGCRHLWQQVLSVGSRLL